MVDNFGSGVGRVLDPQQAQYTQVIWQQGKPPTDHELNLMQQIDSDWRKQFILRNTPSGWLGDDVNSSKAFTTNAQWSNWFKFGRQQNGESNSVTWAVVNGWLVPVRGTKTGTPPGSPNNSDSWNKITLDPPPSNSGDFRSDFAFLEVWLARVPSTPSTLNKPSTTAVYRHGNVEGGASYLPDDIQDPAIGFETTQRVQVQYRVRVVKGLIGLSTYPDGFDPTTVKGQGAATAATSYTFANMRSTLGDAGLWRAGDGTANALGTVDGYVYAIPLCVAFRRNSVAWSGDPSQNLNGGFNRNPLAVDRTGVKTFSTTPTLLAGITATATSLTLVSATDIPLPASPASPVLIQVGDELMTYGGSGAAITGTTVSNLVRGVNGTRAEAHPAGATIQIVSGRPDGLFSDQVAATDILDLRHVVNPNGFNYPALLQSSFDKLLRGQLRANWKRSGGGPQGTFVTYQDRVSASVAGLGVTKVDSPDNIRMIYSDAAVQQRIEVVCIPFASAVVSPAVQPVGATWSLSLSASTTRQRTGGQWDTELSDGDGLGDRILVPVAQFKNTVPGSDGDQVRILNEVTAEGTSGVSTGNTVFTDTGNMSNVRPGDTLVVFHGAAKGTYPVTLSSDDTCTVESNIPAATGVTYVVRKGHGSFSIRVDGQEGPLPPHRYRITPSNPTPSDDAVIEFVGAGTPFPLTASIGKTLYITAHVQYGSGRGVSRRPDSLHSIQMVNPNADLLVQQFGVNASTLPSLRTAWAPLWSKYRNEEYKGLLPVTAESYADLGSKTLVLSPFRRVTLPAAMMTTDGSSANPYTASFTTGTVATSSGTTFTDATKNFPALGVVVNDLVTIDTGIAVGHYRVVGGIGTTTFTVDRAIPATTNISYSMRHVQGVMPLNKADGVTAKWTSTDPLGLFSGTTEGTASTKNFYVTLPRHLIPGWGAVHVPVLPANGTVFHQGINYMLQSREGLSTSVTDSDHNKNYINYTNGTQSYAAMSTGNFSGVSTVPATYNSTFTFGGNTFAGTRFFTDARGMGRKGIELPPFYGVARVFGVYESADYKANGSAFNASTRETTGSGAKNLLRQNFTGPTFWVEVDDDGDSTFILNADVLDLSKSPTPIGSFAAAHYVIEASVFGFDRGSFDSDRPFRLVLSRNRAVAISGTRGNNVTAITGPVTIVPAPVTSSDTALVNYSRTPYQGDPWGSQTSYVDTGYSPGSMSSAIAYQVASSNLDLASLTRPNQKPLEVLAALGFVTTLGTGRISGDVVSPSDYDFRNVAFEDPSAFPPVSGVAPRPGYLLGALSNAGLPDSEVGADYLGCTDRLPLGSLVKDKDFRGGRLSNTSASPFIYLNDLGVGVGTASQSMTATLEQSSVDMNTASLSPGLPGDVLVHVDGEVTNYALLTNFRANRGGSAFVGSGDRPGGEVYAVYSDINGTEGGTRVLTGRAYLVRNAPTSVGANEVSAGDELMLLVITTASEVDAHGHPAKVVIGTNGTSEGYSSADLYRIEGHPLMSNFTRYTVSASDITLPNSVDL
jgi:hypothetical protein